MKTKHKLRLIKGEFMPADAGKVLSGLFSYKINYHQKELFSNQERFSNDLLNSKKRIVQLKTTAEELTKIIDATTVSGQKLQISCVVEITVMDGE